MTDWRKTPELSLLLSLAGLEPGTQVQCERFEGDTLARGLYSSMKLLYRRSFFIFGLSIFAVEIRFGQEIAGRLEALAKGRTLSRTLENQIANLALDAQDAFIQIEFKFAFGSSLFIREIRRSTREVYEFGAIDRELYQRVWNNLPVWYSFLSRRGVRRGDKMFYRIQGEVLRVVYENADGRVLLDERYQEPFARRAVLGGYFVPTSDLRKGLIRSLFDGQGYV